MLTQEINHLCKKNNIFGRFKKKTEITHSMYEQILMSLRRMCVNGRANLCIVTITNEDIKSQTAMSRS